jgi:hypothetical protein
MGLTAMISFDLTLSESEQWKRTEFDKALDEQEGWHKHKVDTTWSKVLASSDFDDAFKEVTKSFHNAARLAKITRNEVKAVAHIGNEKPKPIPPLPLLNEKIREFLNNLFVGKQKSVGGR